MTNNMIDNINIHLEPAVSLPVTLTFAAILVMMILLLAMEEKIHAKKSVIVGFFAVICLALASFFGLMPFGDLILPNGHAIKMPAYIPAVDWEVIAIILGSSIFIDVTSKSGLFTFIAIKLTKTSKGDPCKLLWYYGLMTVLFSAVLNNVTAMIIIGSLTVVSLEKLKQRQLLLGFLIVEALLTNVGGLLTLISSVPNIIVGNAAGISFIKFFITASPYVLLTTCITIFMGAKIFNISSLTSNKDKDQARLLVASFDENDGIQSKLFFRFSIFILIAFILTIALTSILPVIKDLGMGFVAMSFAVIVLLRYKSEVDQFYKAIDWDLISFFIALFVVINVMEHALVLDLIGKAISIIIGKSASILGTGSLLFSAAAFSSVTDNIPLAAMLAKILSSMNIPSDSSLWWSVIFGANLGGNLTPIGSASTLVAVTIMHKHKLPLPFIGFVKHAIPFAAIQIILAILYVILFL
jgi:Na+/H+ antiporter NhaD/arsenite permease-like protein